MEIIINRNTISNYKVTKNNVEPISQCHVNFCHYVTYLFRNNVVTQYHVRFHLTRGNVLVKYVRRKGLCKDFVT